MSEQSAIEIVMGAEINFGNVAKMNPALSLHPIWQIAMEQLRTGIEMLKAEDDDE